MSVELVDASTIVGFVEDEEDFSNSVKARFAALDTNSDGFLSYDEMVKELKKMNLRVDGEDDEVHVETESGEREKDYKSALRLFDRNGDGMVSFEEFKKETKKMMLAMADALGFLPFFMVLHQDSLFLKAVERESCATN